MTVARQDTPAHPVLVTNSPPPPPPPSGRPESTTSLTASLFDYRKIHGRTYQNSKTTEYWQVPRRAADGSIPVTDGLTRRTQNDRAPNDDEQAEGLDITCASPSPFPCICDANLMERTPTRHHFMTLLFEDRLFLAPISDSPQVGWRRIASPA